jgi:hypothetical protein
MSNLKNKIKTIALSTTCHGLPNMLRNENNYLIVTMWTISTLIFIGLSSYTFIQSLILFLKYDTINKIEFKTSSEKFLFPVVSVCNLNPFIKNSSVKLIENVLYDLNITDIVRSEVLDATAGKYLNQHFTFTRFLFQSIFHNSSKEQKTQLLSDLNEMILSCRYGPESCSASDFEWFSSFDFGNCYKFKSDKKVTLPGKTNGLRMELITDQSDSINSLMFSRGVHIFINNQSIDPLRAEGIDISSGYETNIALNKNSFIKLSEPYSDCVKDTLNQNEMSSYLFKLTLSSYGKYTRRSCFDMCYQDYIVENCDCFSILFPNITKNHEPCGLSVAKNKCNLDFHIKFYRTVSQVKCPLLCPNECESAEFKIKVSFSTYPTKIYAQKLIETDSKLSKFNLTNNSFDENYEHLKNNLLSLNVYYDDFDEMVISEVPKTSVPDLIGIIGGNLGLFLGVSILSLLN